MAMLITLFLVLINIFNIVTTNSPNVEGVTAIAAWMMACILFVFGALLGYAYLLWKKKKSCLKRKKPVSKLKSSAAGGGEDCSLQQLRNRRKEEFRSKVKLLFTLHIRFDAVFYFFFKVDDMFLVVFPLLFAIFNLIYWPICLRTPGDYY